MSWQPDSSPGVLLWRASNLWQRRLRAALRAHGLTQAQFLILVSLRLFEDREPVAAQQDLARFCGLDVAAVSTSARRRRPGPPPNADGGGSQACR